MAWDRVTLRGFKSEMSPMRGKVNARTGWRFEGWRACQDLDRDGLGGVPRWFRCSRCNSLVTHGMVQVGGCHCGNRRLLTALSLTWWEIVSLKLGRYPLDTRERDAVRPWR